MKNIVYFILCAFALCACENKNYKVKVTSGNVNVTMNAPTIGIVGVNKVGYDGFTLEEIEEEIFEEIQDNEYYGNYDVYVTLRFEDKYGKRYERESVKVCTLDGGDVKKYVDYSYFRGEIPFGKAFSWNYDYGDTKHEVKEESISEKIDDIIGDIIMYLGGLWLISLLLYGVYEYIKK